MTREESLSIITEAIEDYVCNYVTDTAKAQKMLNAIQTLEQEPCEDAISRQAVLNIIEKEPFKGDAISEIEKLPSVKLQEPKTGHWEWVQYDSNPNIGNWHCSECRTIIPHMPEETDNTPIYKWCPMCGANMVEPQERSE